MPTVNIYYTDTSSLNQLQELTPELKVHIADELSGSDIQLQTNEVSVRYIKSESGGMLANIELEITAHAFGERIQKQDEICLRVREFLKARIDVEEIRVWLLLPQLGHSWK